MQPCPSLVLHLPNSQPKAIPRGTPVGLISVEVIDALGVRLGRVVKGFAPLAALVGALEEDRVTGTFMDDELGVGDPAGELPAGGEWDEPIAAAISSMR
jgi:hypothetical protein